MYTEDSNVRNTLLGRAHQQTAERAGELVFNVLWSYVSVMVLVTTIFPVIDCVVLVLGVTHETLCYHR